MAAGTAERNCLVNVLRKPHEPLPRTVASRERLGRLRAVIRRAVQTARSAELPVPARVFVGRRVIDAAARLPAFCDAPLTLMPVEYVLLLVLARAAGRVKSR